MIIGLLKCDTVKPKFQKDFGDYDTMFQKIFHEKDPDIDFHVFNVVEEEYPKEIDSCDAYLITGSFSSINDKDRWISKLFLFIRDLYRERKKTVGICFGHQLIGKALGGIAKRSENGWSVGVMAAEIKHHESWMSPKLDHFSLITSHQDQVVKMPQDGILLGANSFCPLSMYRVGEHMLCIQGHLEFPPGYAKAIFKDRKNIIGEKKTRKAIDSLKQKTDYQVIVDWMIRFLSK